MLLGFWEKLFPVVFHLIQLIFGGFFPAVHMMFVVLGHFVVMLLSYSAMRSYIVKMSKCFKTHFLTFDSIFVSIIWEKEGNKVG